MSITRKVLRKQGKDHKVLTSTTLKDKQKRERRLARGMMNMRAIMRGLMHASGHPTR